MINLAIALGLAVVGFLLGWVGGNTWIAGILPGFLLGALAYFVLARRSGRQLEAILKRAMAEMEQLKPEQMMRKAQALRSEKAVRDWQSEVIGRARAIMQEGFALQRWQFLIAAQVHAQVGFLDYLQRRYKDARPHLELAWSRNWMAKAMLACIQWREDRRAEALATMEKVSGAGDKEPLFWGVYAWMALESGDRDRAIRLVARGLQKLPGNGPLKAFDDALRNDKKLDTRVFGESWFQFFPEHLTPEQERQMAQAMAARRGGVGPPPPRGRGRPQ